MPAPTQPTLTLARLSPTSFRATIAGDAGAVNRLHYRRHGDTSAFTVGPTRTGPGTLDVTGLRDNEHYTVFVVADNGELSPPAVADVSLLLAMTILGAIQARFSSFPALAAAFPGGLWTGEVAETVQLPYAYARLPRGGYTWTVTRHYLERASLWVYVYALDAAQAESAASQFRGAFDWQRIAFDDGSLWAKVEPRAYAVRADVGRWRDGRLVYRAVLQYDVWVNRQQ